MPKTVGEWPTSAPVELGAPRMFGSASARREKRSAADVLLICVKVGPGLPDG